MIITRKSNPIDHAWLKTMWLDCYPDSNFILEKEIGVRELDDLRFKFEIVDMDKFIRAKLAR